MKNSEQKTLTPEERAKMLDEFIKKGGKIEKIPYGVTNQEMGEPNQMAGWNPPETITPKTYKTRITKAKNKTTKSNRTKSNKKKK